MKYYEQNIENLKQYRNNILEKMNELNLKITESQDERIFSDVAINGESILIHQNNDNLIRFNSCYHPTHEAKIWADQFSLNNLNNVITMFGLGNGTFAKELASRLGEQDFLFVYEPSQQIFLHVLQEYDLSELLLNRNVVITIEGINDFDFHNLLQNVTGLTNMSYQIQCAHPYYADLFKESHIKFWKEIKDTMVHARININTEILFGECLIVNSIHNIKHIQNSNIVDDFIEDINPDLPAIVVAAGPSLRKNIEELKKAKGKSYIFVVDRIVDYVLDNGLEPDFIVTIDPIKPVEFFTKREDLTIPLFCELVSSKDILNVHKGKKIYFNCNGYFQCMYKEVGKKPPAMNPGSSVATAAFATCVKLGFNKIILVGQDLAYDGEFTHAGGIAEKFDNDGDIMVDGVDGKKVRSRYDWYEFLVWFKDIIELLPQIQVIDTKDSGALIPGTVLMPMKEVLEKYCTKETGLEKILKEKQSTFSQEEFKTARKYFDQTTEELYDLKKKAKEAIELCDRQIREFKKNPEETALTVKNFKRISKINKIIHQKAVYYLLDSYITSVTASYIAKIYRFTDDFESDRIETYEKSKKIYQAIIDGVDFANPILEEVLDQLDHTSIM